MSALNLPEFLMLREAAEAIVLRKPDLDWTAWALVLAHESSARVFAECVEQGGSVQRDKLGTRLALQVVPITNLVRCGIPISAQLAYATLSARGISLVLPLERALPTESDAERAGAKLTKKFVPPGGRLEKRGRR